MKYFIPIIFVAILFSSFNSNAQKWLWAKGSHYSYNNEDFETEGTCVALGKDGSIYAGGMFGDDEYYALKSCVFWGTDSLCDSTIMDAYIVKYDSIGNILWTKLFHSNVPNAYSDVENIAADDKGNIYVTGQMWYDTLIIDGHGVFPAEKSPSSVIYYYIVKFDANGNYIWGQSNKGFRFFTVSPASNGGVYLTGSLVDNSTDFGSIKLINDGYQSVFLVKFDSVGNVVWAKGARDGKGVHLSSVGAFSNYNIATDKVGNVYTIGTFDSSDIVFDGDTVTKNNNNSIFLTKYDSSGKLIWAEGFPGYAYLAAGLAVDTSLNIYFSAYFIDPFITIGKDTLVNSGGSDSTSDFFITKLNLQGKALWARKIGGAGNETPYSLAIDPEQNIWATGGFQSNTLIIMNDTMTKLPDSLYSEWSFSDPMFMVQYDPEGNLHCVTSLTSGGDDWNNIAIDKKGFIYLCGDYAQDTSKSMIVGTDTLTNTGIESMFIAKYEPCPFVPINTSVTNLLPNNPFDVSIFPNPSSNEFTLVCNGPLPSDLQLKIYNLSGQLIKQLPIRNSQTNILTDNNLQSGIFICKIVGSTISSKISILKKLVIVK